MKVPTIRYADHFEDWGDYKNTCDGWVFARPECIGGFKMFWRMRCAWLVFTGKMDVLTWKGDQ